MSDDKKGISLRRKKTTRPQISAPRQLSQQRDRSADSRWDAQTTNSTRSREGRPSTSDLVKRRYSTRFGPGGVPQDGLTPPVPAMPSLPPQFATARSDDRSRSRDARSPMGATGKLQVDRRALRDAELEPEKYVQSILADATETDIQSYQDDLQNAKDMASTDLQHNVFQNRTQFIKISKEADKLKSEMRMLRTLMSELTGALGHATSAGGLASNDGAANDNLSVADRKRANRSSVANLEAMWSSHLHVLWKRVEGSQKFLPALPGRHIILESQRWVELNAATWKPRRRVALVLLNDHLLVATEKKRNDLIASANADAKNKRASMYNPSTSSTGQSPSTSFVAERCWPLQDVRLADISTTSSSNGAPMRKEPSTMSNAINIRAGNESFTYATSDTAEKAGLLVAFRKAQEDLRKQMAAEHGQREKELEDLSLFTGRDRRLLKKAAADQAEPNSDGGKSTGLSRSNSVLIDAEGRQQSIRWVETQIDTLDIHIALQRFEQAVSNVENLRQFARSIRSNATAADIIQAKVSERAGRLATSIARQLVQTSAGLERTRENAGWLLRLGFEDMARARYLDARTETIRVRTRQLPFTGALKPYVKALAFTTFTLLLHTFRTFAASFPAASGSAVVKWAKERLDEFNALLGRQIDGLEKGGQTYAECIEIARSQAKILQEVGVDFSGLVATTSAAEEVDGGGAAAAPVVVTTQENVPSSAGPMSPQRRAVGLGVSA